MREKKDKITAYEKTKRHYRLRLDQEKDKALIKGIDLESEKSHMSLQDFIKHALLSVMPEEFFNENFGIKKETFLEASHKSLETTSDSYIKDNVSHESNACNNKQLISADPDGDCNTEDFVNMVKKLDRLSNKFHCTFETYRHIVALYDAFGKDRLFTRDEAIEVVGLKKDGTMKLLAMMRKCGILERKQILNSYHYIFCDTFSAK